MEQPDTETTISSRPPWSWPIEPGRRYQCGIWECPYPAMYYIRALVIVDARYTRCRVHKDELISVFANHWWVQLLRHG